jgi:hypothetical protein
MPKALDAGSLHGLPGIGDEPDDLPINVVANSASPHENAWLSERSAGWTSVRENCILPALGWKLRAWFTHRGKGWPCFFISLGCRSRKCSENCATL